MRVFYGYSFTAWLHGNALPAHGQVQQFAVGNGVHRVICAACSTQLDQHGTPALDHQCVLLQPQGQTRIDFRRTIGHLQNRHGDCPLLPVDIVPERFTRQRLPVVFHRQTADLLQVPGNVQRTADGEVCLGDVGSILPGHVGGFDDRQQCVQMRRTGDHARQQFRHTGFDIRLITRLPDLAGRTFQQLVKLEAQCSEVRTEVCHVTTGVQLIATATQEPARCTTPQTHQLVHQRQLDFGRNLVVQCLDLTEPVRQVEDVTHDHVGTGHRSSAHAGRLFEPLHEGDAHVVDQIVGDLRADDLALQAMAAHGRGKLGAQRRRERGFHITRQIVVIRHTGFQQRFLKVDLAVRDQHRQLGTTQALLGRNPLGNLLFSRQELDGAIKLATRLQVTHQTLVFGNPLVSATGCQRQRLGLLVVVAQHQVADFVGHAFEQLIALLLGHVTGLHHFVEQDLDVHFVIGAVHTARVVDEVGVGRAAIEAELDTAQLGHAQVAALAHNLATQLVAVDAQRIVGLVADISVRLIAGLHVGADTAVPQQIDRCLEQSVQQFGRGQLVSLDVEARLHLFGDGDTFQAAREDPAASGHDAGVVVGPGRARQIEQALTLCKAGGRVRIRIDEDVQVIERCDQLQLVRHQQAVAEHVTGHVADTDHADAVLLHIDVAFTEVTLHAHPCALGGDAHLLVIVTGRTTGSEGVAQPEAVVDGNAVGDVGERCRALVGGHHQIRVIIVMTHDVDRRHQRALLKVVGDVQQPGDEDAVASDCLGLHFVAVAGGRQATRHEAALGTYRHNDRVLNLLGFYQAQHFGTEVFLAVRPAQAATRHVAEAQMHAFDTRRINEDFKLGHRLGQFGNQARVELEAEIALALPVGIGLIEVGPQRGFDQVQITTQDAVFVEHLHVVQRSQNRLFQTQLLVVEIVGTQLARQIEAGLEQTRQLAGDVGVIVQRGGDVTQVKAQTNLLQITRIGTQQRHIAPRQAGGEHQTVESIVFGIAAHDVHERILEGVIELLDIEVQSFAVGKGEIVNPELATVGMVQAVRKLAQHAQAKVFQNRQHVGQRQRCVGVIQLAMQLLAATGQWLVEAHHQRIGFAEAQYVLHVDDCRMRRKALAVARREAFREVGQHVGAVGFTEAFDHQTGVVVLPRTARLNNFVFQLGDVDVQVDLRVYAQNQLHTRQHRFREERPELAIAGLEAVHQDLLDLLAYFGGIHVARHISQAVAEAAVRVLAQEHANLVALLNLHDGHDRGEQFVHRRLEKVVTRQYFDHLRQFLAQVRLGVETGATLDLGDLATDVRNLPHALAIHRRGVQAHETTFFDDLARRVDLTDRNVIRVRRTVHAAWMRRLGKRQQHRFLQVFHRVIFDVQFFAGQAGAQQAGQPEEGRLVVHQLAAFGVVAHFELFVTEEGEVVVHQPLQEDLDLGLFLDIGVGLVGIDTGQQLMQTRFHRPEIFDDGAYFAKYLLQLARQHVQLADVGAAVDLQVHQRFLQHVVASGALGQQLKQFASSPATHAQHGGLQGVDAIAAAVQLGTYGVDQKRKIMMQHFNGSMSRLPAVALVIGVVDPDLRVSMFETLQQAPRGQGAACQVGEPPLGEFVERNDAEELLGKQRHLWQCLFADVLSQCRLQLMLEVGLAGCGEERHLWYSALAFIGEA
ncbi:hypothetical protein ALQ54_05713 [Pseudomonas syringae]|nr:hypothetical protein ALQ54_05713 [Pseudomonas syringae]